MGDYSNTDNVWRRGGGSERDSAGPSFTGSNNFSSGGSAAFGSNRGNAPPQGENQGFGSNYPTRDGGMDGRWKRGNDGGGGPGIFGRRQEPGGFAPDAGRRMGGGDLPGNDTGRPKLNLLKKGEGAELRAKGQLESIKPALGNQPDVPKNDSFERFAPGQDNHKRFGDTNADFERQNVFSRSRNNDRDPGNNFNAPGRGSQFNNAAFGSSGFRRENSNQSSFSRFSRDSGGHQGGGSGGPFDRGGSGGPFDRGGSGGPFDRGDSNAFGQKRSGGRHNQVADIDFSSFSSNKPALADISLIQSMSKMNVNKKDSNSRNENSDKNRGGNVYVPPHMGGVSLGGSLKLRKPKKSIQRLAPEQVSSIVYKVLKDFFSLLQKTQTLKDIQSQLKGQDFEKELLTELLNKSQKLEIRDKKTVIGLLTTMKEKKLITDRHTVVAINGLAERLVTKYEEDLTNDKVNVFRDHFKFLESNDVFKNVDSGEFSSDLKKLVTPVSDVILKYEASIADLLSSSLKGEALMEAYKTQVVLANGDGDPCKFNSTEGLLIIVELFSKLLVSNLEEIKADKEASWLEAENYGALLGYVLNLETYESEKSFDLNESSTETIIKTQVEIIYSLQTFFNRPDVGFITSAEDESLFEKCLMQLYEHFNEDAFFFWKGDKYRIATQLSPGDKEAKAKALQEAVQFFEFMEDDEDEDDDDEEASDEDENEAGEGEEAEE